MKNESISVEILSKLYVEFHNIIYKEFNWKKIQSDIGDTSMEAIENERIQDYSYREFCS